MGGHRGWESSSRWMPGILGRRRGWKRRSERRYAEAREGSGSMTLRLAAPGRMLEAGRPALVRRRAPGEYEFVELKVGSDTPSYAASEVLQYAALYAFARRPYADLERTRRELLQAHTIHLRALAPRAFYEKERVDALASRISAGLAGFCATEALPWTMGFASGLSASFCLAVRR